MFVLYGFCKYFFNFNLSLFLDILKIGEKVDEFKEVVFQEFEVFVVEELVEVVFQEFKVGLFEELKIVVIVEFKVVVFVGLILV